MGSRSRSSSRLSSRAGLRVRLGVRKKQSVVKMDKRLKYLVIHCTATPERMNVTPQQIINWHTKPKPFGRGWKQVGYSKLFLLDGKIHSFIDEDNNELVDEWEITNGVSGINNIARHICYVGGCDKQMNQKDTRTQKQIDAMVSYLKEFKKK